MEKRRYTPLQQRQPASGRQAIAPKGTDKKARIIRDSKQFAEFISKRDRKLLDRLEEYDRTGRA